MAGRRRNHPLPHGERRFRAVFAALGVLAVAAVLFGTRRGIGLANDSVNYLRAARGVLDGRGLIVMQAFHYAGPVPMTHWPPLYPLLLAASGELGLDMEAFARGLHALLLAANVLLIGRFAFDRGLGLAASVAAALLFATNREVLYVHQMVWTEPLFLFTILLGFTLLARHLEAPRRALVWSAGACAALAVMTRYVGVAAVAAGALGLMLFARGPRSARARDALRFAAPACVVLSLWALHNAWVGRAPSWGELELRLPRASPLLRPLSEVVRDWLWPFSSALPVAGARIAAPTAAAILAGSAALAFAPGGSPRARDVRDPPADSAVEVPRGDPRPLLLLLLYAVCHLALLYGTVLLFFDAFVPGTRHLLPALVALLLALVCVAARMASGARPVVLAVIATALAAFVATHLVCTACYENERSLLGTASTTFATRGRARSSSRGACPPGRRSSPTPRPWPASRAWMTCASSPRSDSPSVRIRIPSTRRSSATWSARCANATA